ncbi:MAG: zinc ribbon domain-containing protein [Terriglobales bacterium]
MSYQQPVLTQPTSKRFGEELKIIPSWAYVLAGIAFVCIQILMNVLIPAEKNPPPQPLLGFLGFLAGAVLACYFLLVGYVNVDAGRRGMSRTLWTVLVIFVPNALGFILYFLLRQPATQPCPQCHAPVQASFNYCPTCHTKLHPHCAQCQRPVRLTDTFCPYCGYTLDEIVH